MTIRAVVFDFDGVLANTERLHFEAIQETLAAHGRSLDERTYFDRYLGYGDRDIFVELARDTAWTLDQPTLDALMSLKANRYRVRMTSGNALYPLAAACVRGLSPRFALAIASGSLRHEIRTILTGGGLLDAFPVIVGADDVTAGKPAPDPYIRAAALLGVKPSDAVAIEDSRWGLESAHAAGMRTIGITTSYPASALVPSDAVVDALDEISPEMIDRL